MTKLLFFLFFMLGWLAIAQPLERVMYGLESEPRDPPLSAAVIRLGAYGTVALLILFGTIGLIVAGDAWRDGPRPFAADMLFALSAILGGALFGFNQPDWWNDEAETEKWRAKARKTGRTWFVVKAVGAFAFLGWHVTRGVLRLTVDLSGGDEDAAWIWVSACAVAVVCAIIGGRFSADLHEFMRAAHKKTRRA